MSDHETLQVYADQAQHYADMTDAVSSDDPMLNAFIADIPQGGHVLDLGCGPGASAACMANAGLRVDAFDPVPEMVALASRHTGVTALQAGFDDLKVSRHYDGIWANFSLLHAPRAALPGHLDRIVTALKPNGVFHIAVKTGAGTKRDGLGRQYTYYTEDELIGFLRDAGITVFDTRSGASTGLDGVVAPWIALRGRA